MIDIRKRLGTLAALCALACFACGSSANTIVLNEGFEGAAVGSYFNVAITGTAFIAQASTVDILSAAACTPTPTGQCAELLTGSTMTSNALFAAGTYSLSFDLSAASSNTTGPISVFLGSCSPCNFTAPSFGFEHETINGITVSFPNFLSFFEAEGAALVDNVVLTSVTTVPEAATLLLVALGLATLGLRRR